MGKSNFLLFLIINFSLCYFSPSLIYGQKADSIKVVHLEPIVLIGLTPTPGSETRLDRVAGNVQVANGADINQMQVSNISDFLGYKMGSIHLNDPGGNPLQREISYRGFRASPLLGISQGLAIYQDGVRINESFGDVVNWDLIPTASISSIQLIPGSNPQFGLNALGGALSLQTKSGFDYNNHRVKVTHGSFNSNAVEFESGNQYQKIAYYITGNFFKEDGWRDFSASKSNQLFGKVSWQSKRFNWNLGLSYGNNNLTGNGASPIELLEIDRKAIYTHPDQTKNVLGMLNWQGEFEVAENLILSGTTYVRLTKTATLNGDDSTYELCEDGSGYLCHDEDDNTYVYDQYNNPVIASADVSSGTNNYSDTKQGTYGGTIQVSSTKEWLNSKNIFVGGASFDGGKSKFKSMTELAKLTQDRGTIGSGIYDAASYTNVNGMTQHSGIFAVNTYTPFPELTITGSLRLNYSHVELDDQLGVALNGSHSFTNLNPSVGFTYKFNSSIGFNFYYGISNRTPTPVELTCADPDAPCRLPNAFLADPPLDQVVANTFEGGFRGQVLGVNWALSAFRTDLKNDIYFLSAGPTRNSGYFDNIGHTRRQGIEVTLERSVKRFKWYANYSYLDATFQENFAVNSPNHPDAIDGEIQVLKDDRLPLIPNHMFKLGADVALHKRVSLGTNILFNSGQYLRGDEANLLHKIDHYTLLNLRMQISLFKFMNLYVKVSNVFNRAYETAGLLGEPDEIEEFQDFENPRFFTPGSPRMIKVGLEFLLEKQN